VETLIENQFLGNALVNKKVKLYRFKVSMAKQYLSAGFLHDLKIQKMYRFKH